jgi:carotenoid cleavage dioxygenase-like enzyme
VTTEAHGEFPRAHPELLGRRPQFVYMSQFPGGCSELLFDGVVKVDLVARKVVGSIPFGHNWCACLVSSAVPQCC